MSSVSNHGRRRNNALELLKNHLKDEKLIAHCLASEAIMRALARHLGHDEDSWGVAGLLHDIDYELTQGDMSSHGLEADRILEAHGIPGDIREAIKKHNAEGLGLKRSTVFDFALSCSETITGMIVATALVYPDKKLASVKPGAVTKRMKTRHFARNVSRERISECENIGIALTDFVTLSLEAMKEISEQLGL
jgi:putative nucleotidyltransferase with HDIG domain